MEDVDEVEADDAARAAHVGAWFGCFADGICVDALEICLAIGFVVVAVVIGLFIGATTFSFPLPEVEFRSSFAIKCRISSLLRMDFITWFTRLPRQIGLPISCRACFTVTTSVVFNCRTMSSMAW